MDYFHMPDFEKFKKIYVEFLSSPKYISYYVKYEDDNNNDELSNYSPLSILYKNFITNIEVRNKQ